MQYKDFKLPFGKHKDKKLEEIPLRYLDWLLGEETRVQVNTWDIFRKN